MQIPFTVVRPGLEGPRPAESVSDVAQHATQRYKLQRLTPSDDSWELRRVNRRQNICDPQLSTRKIVHILVIEMNMTDDHRNTFVLTPFKVFVTTNSGITIATETNKNIYNEHYCKVCNKPLSRFNKHGPKWFHSSTKHPDNGRHLRYIFPPCTSAPKLAAAVNSLSRSLVGRALYSRW